MQLRRVLYISRAHPGLQDFDLRQIFGLAEVLHRRADLSGVLAYTGRHFVQVIEGPAFEVQQLLQFIARDSRHGGMRLLCDEAPRARQFGDWRWLCVDSPDVVDEVDQSLANEGTSCAEADALMMRLLARSAPESQAQPTPRSLTNPVANDETREAPRQRRFDDLPPDR